MNLPNKLTLLRITLTFLIMACLFAPGAAAKALALGLFGLASLTDWLDGYLARRQQHVTPLGVLLDPIADKVLVIGLLLAFVQLELVRAWMVLVIAIREFLITGVRLYAAGHHIVIPAAREGKHKTFSQMATIFLILALLLARDLLDDAGRNQLEAWMPGVVLSCMWITVLLTVISGASFFWRNRTVLIDATSR